jgi:2-oxoglutarate/2-oxoacid ferredoxin oxidoreductase subunit beta
MSEPEREATAGTPAAAARRARSEAAGSEPISVKLTAKDFKTDQEVRWCPGCGDYAILAAVQSFMPELGIPRERIVFISGIGCSSRFPYYMNTYGLHSIHGRAPAIATGLSVTRPDLQVWVVTGDGDALSIGGNHLIHALRRNVNLKILLFNNRIYGLTKGQYSPTSELGKITKSTPAGSADFPFNPISLALGAEASFVARTIDSDRKHLQQVLRAAAAHQGSAFVEIYQNCNIFNDGAFDLLKEPQTRDEALIRLEHGKPITFGATHTNGAGTVGEYCVVHPPGGFGLEVRPTASVPATEIVVHDETVVEPAYAFALSRLPGTGLRHTPIGVFRAVRRSSYDELVRDQVRTAVATVTDPEADLGALLNTGDTWTIL